MVTTDHALYQLLYQGQTQMFTTDHPTHYALEPMEAWRRAGCPTPPRGPRGFKRFKKGSAGF